LTTAKHRLRDWLEERLGSAAERVDVTGFERQVNSAIRQAGLTCENSEPCPGGENLSGSLDAIQVQRNRAFLVVITGLAIECGFDHSVYVYSWNGERWMRVWQNEQNTYTEKDYLPQDLHAVLISPYNLANDYLVLTLGSESWCSSNWHRVYYRLYRLGPDLQAAPLLSGAEYAYLGAHDPPIQGSVSADDVLIEFTIGSIDGGVHSREAIRHYTVAKGGIKRVDPLALGPRDFVEEWIVADWRDSRHWSEDGNRRSMLQWHERLKKATGEFIFPTMHCRTPDFWQVGFGNAQPSAGGGATGDAYFLVRWRPPYGFSMVDVRGRPWPSCTHRDPEADTPRTLFPVQAWR
jgi:hypothetical protein